MQRQNVRVILASEHPEVRHFLREVVEEESGAVILGQAENATEALALAEHLRPDVAIIDCYLPHTMGSDTILLSRVGGLDTAQSISEEIPNIRVILLNNMDTVILPYRSLNQDVGAFFSMERMATNIPFTLQDLCHEVVPSNALIFANVETKQEATIRQDVLFGGLGILGGLMLMVALAFAGAFAFVALERASLLLILLLAGVAIIGVGIGLLWKRSRMRMVK
jgi:CheY-like chemotaxis protein